MTRLVFFFVALLYASLAFAQGTNCDVAQPTSGTGTAGQSMTVHACHNGLDTNGNAITGWALYVGATRTTPTMTKSATAGPVSGKFEYTTTITVPSTAGVVQIQTAALSGTIEGAKSAPFALTVSLPRTAPVAPAPAWVE